MNPWNLTPSELLIWGLVLHLIADWLFQTEWMVQNKMMRRLKKAPYDYKNPDRKVYGPWYDRHPAAYVHSGIHLICLAPIFGWTAIPIALSHFIIDMRWPVEKWGKFMRHTQPAGKMVFVDEYAVSSEGYTVIFGRDIPEKVVLYDVGTEVRFWVDQVFHITCIAIAALAVGV